MGRVTLQTIADEVGVSRMTVSNAFSRPDQLSPALRAKILSVADRLGYCGPDPAARTLSRGRSGTVGVLFTDTLTYAFTDEVATTFLAGVAAVLESEGTGLTVLSTPRRGPTGSVSQAVVDGLIIYSVDTNSPGLETARRRGLPLVLVDQPLVQRTATIPCELTLRLDGQEWPSYIATFPARMSRFPCLLAKARLDPLRTRHHR